MKKFYGWALASMVVWGACSEQTDGYEINGTAEGATDGDTVYVCNMGGFLSLFPEDTAVISGGKFRFTGKTEGATLRILVAIHEGEPIGFGEFILENAKINASLSQDPQQSVVEGGENGRLWKEFSAAEEVLDKQMEEPWTVANDSDATEEARAVATATLDSLGKVRTTAHKEFIKSHVPSAIADMILGYYYQEFDEADQSELIDLLQSKQPDYPVIRELVAERKASAATAIGQKFTEIEELSTDGKIIKLSDLVSANRYVLVDFWASWCGPCRAEMPNVVSAYEKYKDKGLEILGVSLDNDPQSWQTAIGKLQLTWPQVSDLRGWESQAAAAYNVRAIPANVLISTDGTIVGRNLMGEELEEKLAEVLK